MIHRSASKPQNVYLMHYGDSDFVQLDGPCNYFSI